MITEEDLKNLVPAVDFVMGVLNGDYEFSGDNWGCQDIEEVIGFGKMVTEFQNNFRRCKLFFQVDPQDNTSDTLVLQIPDDFGNFWQVFNSFTEEFGTGDRLEAYYPGPEYELMWFFLWYD